MNIQEHARFLEIAQKIEEQIKDLCVVVSMETGKVLLDDGQYRESLVLSIVPKDEE